MKDFVNIPAVHKQKIYFLTKKSFLIGKGFKIIKRIMIFRIIFKFNIFGYQTHDYNFTINNIFFNNMGKLKVIVLSGFLGSGKTTFIKNVIENSQNMRISIIMNDVSEFDMDMDLLKKNSIQFKKTKDMIEMGGGCVCCTLKDEMIKQVRKIHKSKLYDYLFIEATGISTPLPVAQAFNASDSIMKICDIYSMITVIDTQNFFLNIKSDEIIQEEEKTKNQSKRVLRPRKKHNHNHQNEQAQEKPTIAELMIDQLEVANIIVLNKIDLVTKKNLNIVMANLKAINPDSEIIPTNFSKVDLKSVFSVKRFDLEKAEKDIKWIMEKQKIQDIPQTIKYNISSFVYERRRPFNPQKIHQLLYDPKHHQFWASITRAKGFFWLANYPRFAFTLQKAGSRLFINLDQPWWCQISRQFWGDDENERKEAKQFISRFMDKNNSDKRVQLVFISQDLKKEEITQVLDKCLIAEKELQNYEEIYSKLQDPFGEQWKEGQEFFENQGILVQNDGDWEEVDEDEDSCDEEQDQSEIVEQKAIKTRSKRK